MVTKKSKRKIAITPFGSDIVSQDIAVSDAAVNDAAGVDHSPSPSPFASDDEEDVGEGEEEEEDGEEEIGATRSYKHMSMSRMRKKSTVASIVIAPPSMVHIPHIFTLLYIMTKRYTSLINDLPTSICPPFLSFTLALPMPSSSAANLKREVTGPATNGKRKK